MTKKVRRGQVARRRSGRQKKVRKSLRDHLRLVGKRTLREIQKSLPMIQLLQGIPLTKKTSMGTLKVAVQQLHMKRNE
jgi:hypothetical protein